MLSFLLKSSETLLTCYNCDLLIVCAHPNPGM